MLKPIDAFFDHQDEPIKSCLGFLRSYLLSLDKNVTEAWKYGMPFYCYKNKMFCYLWIHKKLKQPYIGIVEGGKIDFEGLIQEKRARMKIYMISATVETDIRRLNKLMKKVLVLYN